MSLRNAQTLLYGQPVNGITQVGYVVENIDEAMRSFTTQLGVGPWFLSGPFETTGAEYRRKPTNIRLKLAVAFSGHMQVEVIQQLDDQPSVYRELIERSGYGFHHFALATKDIDAEIARLQEGGAAIAFKARSPRGPRVTYMDGVNGLPGMIELIEMTPRQEELYVLMYAAALAWDGSDLVRPAERA
ncbi:glyoxalase/Bleomycin resistance /Dioxygenase superfamily protein [Paraburkholderia xenovorans LB400]|uniref:Methylmalonyl-CoA epimerase n=1 Tax=Paraburkholderia xenovorans (strain LB400) TaxID=266265 RepID=Q13I71_PARXL|nr:VOC family protein [Paraburkholderia xenovorans]ABE36218.1 methylmalonyl-CoA epimerase [Paraburkholderia xenovorans LB400]AIP35089.1 glyoxalase/Bleomycin resistance /Dioxygenase superfamily protein [Paraburkholderia xenovorans LB400]